MFHTLCMLHFSFTHECTAILLCVMTWPKLFWSSTKLGRLCNWGSLWVCLLVCQKEYCRRNQPISLKFGVMIHHWAYKWQHWLAFGGDPVPDTDSGSVFHFPQHCMLRDLLAFLIQSLAAFHEAWQNIDADTRINSLHFGSDLADTHIQNNQEIQIWFLGHFWLRKPKFKGSALLRIVLESPNTDVSCQCW